MSVETLLQLISDKLDTIAERLQPKSEQVCPYTLFDWLSEWERTYRSPNLRDKGYSLRMNINKHIKPNIENKPLNEYTAHDVQMALNCVGSERMRQIVRQIYNQSFREAARSGYIDRNPVDNVAGIQHTYHNGRALSKSEQAELLQVTVNDRFSVLWRFYLLTGSRPSEPLSVAWSDISADTIRIKGTKTSHADRVLPLSDDLRKLLDSIPKDGELLFPYSYRTVLNRFNYFIRPKLSFDMTIKDLRHTFGTRCIECGVSMKTVQKWLGHSNYGTTANIYSHITTDFEREEIKKLNAEVDKTTQNADFG